MGAGAAERLAPSAPLRWEAIDDVDAMEAIGPAWDALAADGPLSSLTGASFALAFRAAFVGGRDRPTLHVLRRGGELAAVLLLGRRGRLTGAWTSLDNAHSPCSAFAARLEEPEVLEQTLHRLLTGAGSVRLRGLPFEGPHHRALHAAAFALGLPLSVSPYPRDDIYLQLVRPWSTFEATVPKSFVLDVGTKLRKLEQAGRMEFQRLTGGPELPAALAECFDVEALGWKGVTGSPTKRDPHVHRFYCELAGRASGRGQLALYLLKLDGHLIAFRYCLRSGRRVDCLKTSFDPAWKRYSPGLLSLFLIARQEIAEGEIDSIHDGPPSADKLRWATGVVPLVTVRIYSRGVRGQLSYMGPRLIKAMENIPPIGRAVAWMRRTVRHAKDERRRLLNRIGKTVARRRVHEGRG